MDKFTNSKNVEIKGRKFVLKKFDARTGSFMLIKIAGIIAPMFKSIDLNKIKVDEGETPDLSGVDITGVISSLSGLSEKEFTFIQDKCLNVCFEDLPAGLTKVLSIDGTFGVVGLEDDTMSIMALTAHALIFNVTGFFAESPLGSLMGAAMSSIRSTVKI